MSEIEKIIDKALFELVKKVLSLSKRYDDNDYFGYSEENPDAKVEWIVEALKK